MTTQPSILPGQSHGQRSLAGYMHRITELDMMEATEHARVLHLHFTSNHQQPISEPVLHDFLALPLHNGLLF